MTMKPCADRCGDLVTGPYAKYCACCRPKHRGKKRKYVWTAERDAFLRARYTIRERNCKRRIAALWGWPVWVVQIRASELGLTKPAINLHSRAWTRDDDALIAQFAGRRTPKWMAGQLRRSVTAVIVRMKRQHLSAMPDGYSQGDVALGFGVSRDSVEKWVRRGWLAIAHDVTGAPWRITEAAIVRFVATHRTAFDLGKVDQGWFLDLVFAVKLRAEIAA